MTAKELIQEAIKRAIEGGSKPMGVFITREQDGEIGSIETFLLYNYKAAYSGVLRAQGVLPSKLDTATEEVLYERLLKVVIDEGMALIARNGGFTDDPKENGKRL